MGIDILNEILNEFNNDGYVEEDYTLDKDFVSIIKESKCPKANTPYHSKMGEETITEHTLDFLKTISPKYAKRLEKLLNTYHVDFDYDEDVSKVELVDDSKFIRINKQKNIEDSYTLTHEAIHEYNMNPMKPTQNWDLITEALSILAEMLQKDYFAKLEEPPRDYKNNESDTLYALYIKALLLDFEIKLIDAHAKNAKINKYILADLIGNDPLYSKLAFEHLEKIIANRHLDFYTLQRNVIGGIISTHMYERISKNPKLIKEFIELNDWCNEMDFVDTLKYLDLELEDEDRVILSRESVKELRREFKKRCKRVSL